MASTGGEMEKELLSFLDCNARADLKLLAIHHILGITGTPDGVTFIGRSETLLRAIGRLCTDTDCNVSREAVLCLVNLSSDENICSALTESEWGVSLLSHLFQSGLDPKNKEADDVCSCLSNVTRSSSCAEKLAGLVLHNNGLERVVEALTKPNFNSNADLRYLATFLMNMTQTTAVQHALAAPPQRLLQQLLPCISLSSSPSHRKGIVGVVKNCCFVYGKCIM